MAAIERAGLEMGEFAEEEAYRLAQAAIAQAQQTIADDKLTVEQMQDAVEDTLLRSPYKKDRQGVHYLSRSASKAARDCC